MKRAAALGFLAGVVTAALLLTIALLRDLSAQEARRVVPLPYEPDETDEAGA